MKEQHIPVGIYNREIFIARLEDGKTSRDCDGRIFFDVIRPVEDSELEWLRDQSEREDEYKDIWKYAVAAGDTEESFQDWYDCAWNEDFDEDDPEDFPTKDDSYCEYVDEEKRLAAEEFLRNEYGIRVGTWVASGCYPPAFRNEQFKGWDYVFDDALSKKIAKDYEDSKK